MPKINPNTLRVKGWDKWQTYRKDRGQPPWIKLHQSLRRDPDWVDLSDAQKGQLVSLWLLAADRNGVIPYDPIKIQKLLYLDHKFDLEFFVLQGFLIKGNSRRQLDANLAPTWRQHDALEIEAEAETEIDRSDGFDEWYAKYPRKVAKSAAEKAWNKLKSCEKLAATEGLSTWPFSDDPKFIPHPASWLNGSRWEDETTSHVSGEDYEDLI